MRIVAGGSFTVMPVRRPQLGHLRSESENRVPHLSQVRMFIRRCCRPTSNWADQHFSICYTAPTTWQRTKEKACYYQMLIVFNASRTSPCTDGPVKA